MGVDSEEEACNEGHNGVAEGAPHAGLAVLESVPAAEPLRERLKQANPGDESGGDDDRAHHNSEHEVGAQQRLVDPDREWRNQSRDERHEDRQVPLHPEAVLKGPVEEHDDQRAQRVRRVDGAHLGAGEAEAGLRVGQPDLEEGPPNAPGHEEEQQVQGALQVPRILERFREAGPESHMRQGPGRRDARFCVPSRAPRAACE